MRRPPVYPDYAFTEIRTFHVSEKLVLEDAASAAGKIWATTIRTYLEDSGTKLLWWGRLEEDRQRVKLVVDWTHAEHQACFEKSSYFTQLQESWKEITNSPVQARLYVLSGSENYRRNAFSKTAFLPIISTILTFHFPADFNRFSEWDTAWAAFSIAALKTPGGAVSSGTCAGWSVDRETFCGVVKFADIEGMKGFLAGEEPCLGRLEELAGGMDVEFAGLLCLEDGWLGGVTRTRREYPELGYLVQTRDRIL